MNSHHIYENDAPCVGPSVFILPNNVMLCFPVLQQMHTDVATGQIHAELQEAVHALDELIAELQELNGKLRQQ